MNFSHNIIDMNNNAVGFLLQGNGDGAVQTLGAALSSLQLYQEFETAAKAHLDLQQQHSMQDDDSNIEQGPQHQDCQTASSLSDHLLHSMAATHSDSPMVSIPLTKDGMADGSSGTFSVFNQAMTIDKGDLIFGDEDLKDGSGATISQNYHRLLAMLLYNMGLSLHLQSVQNGKTAELKGALDLYEMAFSVVETEWSRFDVDDLMLLLMALFNNLGHIHSNLYNLKQRETCIDWLTALAGHPTFHKLMQRDGYAPFFMNLLVVLKQQQLISPAA